MGHFVEIRSYNLKPGRRQEFHRLFLEEAFPMLQRWKVDVVAYGHRCMTRTLTFSCAGMPV
jgi:hypothetical protein